MLRRLSIALLFLFSFSSFADPNSDLESALWSKSLSGVRAALNNGANPRMLDVSRHNWIHIAVIAEFDAAIGVLAAAGTPINGRNDIGQTPAHLAANEGQVEILEQLERRGANLFLSDRSGQQPSDLARTWHHEEALEMLQNRARDLQTAAQDTNLTVAAHDPAAPTPRRSFFCCFGCRSVN